MKGYQGARPANAWYAVEKWATRHNFVHCKISSQISTFNARTLTSESQISELTCAAIESKQDISCIQENRHYHPNDTLKHHDLGDNWLLATGSCWKNNINASVGGVGILLSPRAQKTLSNIEIISPRIIIASFNGNPRASIICCYSPTNCSNEQDIKIFYDELSSLIRQIPKHHVIILAGDFNAKLGQEKWL